MDQERVYERKKAGVSGKPQIFSIGSGFLSRSSAFLVIGLIAFGIDAITFNALTFLGPNGHGVLYNFPLASKACAILFATVFTYVGNRYWTFASRNIEQRLSRYVLFVAINLIAMGLQLGSLAFSRYVLHFDGVIADNISGTIVGQMLATIFRFFTYDKWVFPDSKTTSR